MTNLKLKSHSSEPDPRGRLALTSSAILSGEDGKDLVATSAFYLYYIPTATQKGRSIERKEQKRKGEKKEKKGGFERPCMLLRFQKKGEKKKNDGEYIWLCTLFSVSHYYYFLDNV